MKKKVVGAFTVLMGHFSQAILLAVVVFPGSVLLATDCVPAPEGLAGWWRAEGNTIDSSSFGSGGILRGGATYGAGEVGAAFMLDGVNSYVEIPDSDRWAFGAGDFTIEFWIKLRSLNQASSITEPAAVFIANDEGRFSVNKWFVSLGGGKLCFLVSGPTLGDHFLIQAPFEPELNHWYHLAIVRSASVFTAYSNGVLIGSETANLVIPNPDAPLTIGAAEGGYFVNGLLDEVSIYRRALTPDEVRSIYAASSAGKCGTALAPSILEDPQSISAHVGENVVFHVVASGSLPLAYQWRFEGMEIPGATSPTLSLENIQTADAGSYSVSVSNSAGQVISSDAILSVLTPNPCAPVTDGIVNWWRAEENTSDQVSSDAGVLRGGASFARGKVGAAFSFNGTNALVEVPDTDAWAFGTNNFSIEFWVRFRYLDTNSSVSQPAAMFIGNDEGRYQVNKWVFSLGGGRLCFIISSPTLGDHFLIQAPFSPKLGEWYHLAMVRQGDVFTAFTNGVAAGSQTESISIPNPQAPLTIGGGENLFFLNGLMDEVSIYRRALSVSDVYAIYAAAESGKCLGNSPGCTPPPSGLVGWWSGDDLGNDSIGQNEATFHNAAGLGAGEVGQAFVLNGANQYLEVSNAPSLNPSGSFSIEGWIYPNRDQEGTIMAKWGDNGDFFNNRSYYFGIVPGRGVRFGISDLDHQWDNAFHLFNPTNVITLNAWNHVAAVYDQASGMRRIYVNGAKVGERSDPPITVLNGIANVGIGAQISSSSTSLAYFDGRIDELSFYSNALSADEIQRIYAAGSQGKCRASNPPFIAGQPTEQNATVGDNVTFTVTAGGSLPLSYQWTFDGEAILGATGASLVLEHVQTSQAGDYAVVVSNPVGSATSSNAVLTVNYPPALVQVGDAGGVAGSVVGVPILLKANGNENALGFSLNFNPGILTYSSASLGQGATGGSLLINANQAGSGRLGVACSLPSDTVFASGTQTVAVINFALKLSSGPVVTPIGFGDVPTLRQLSDVKAQVLPAAYAGGSLSVTSAGFEGDVTPRPNGDRAVTITDWVLEGRYVARLDSPTNNAEFRRADCAPRVSSGDGAINVSDWVQVGRFAAGMDPVMGAGGPDAPSGGTEAPPHKLGGGARRVMVLDSMILPNQAGTVPIDLESEGDENALSLSLCFDPKVVTYAGAKLGNSAAGGVLNINANEAASGRLAFVLALPIGQSFSPGKQEILNVDFRARPEFSGNYALSLCDQPVPRAVSDANASTLTADYVDGAIAVNPRPALAIKSLGDAVQLSWPLWATNFTLQEAGGGLMPSSSWTNILGSPVTTNDTNMLNLPITGTNTFYRLSR